MGPTRPSRSAPWRRRRGGKDRHRGLVAVARSSAAAAARSSATVSAGQHSRAPAGYAPRGRAQGGAGTRRGRRGRRPCRKPRRRRPESALARCHAGEEGHGEEGADSRARNRSAPAPSIPPAAARALPAAREIRRTRASSAGCSASSVPGGSSGGRARGVRQWRAPARRRRLLPLLHSVMSASAELEGAATARSASGLPPAAARPPPSHRHGCSPHGTRRSLRGRLLHRQTLPLELLLEEETDHSQHLFPWNFALLIATCLLLGEK
ncbi:unnamed protein product [Urochloa humidicola]